MPAVLQAKAALEEARHDLEQAELNLRYCDIVSEIDGVVIGRNVNPGNDVQAGQSLMAVRSLHRDLDRRQFQGNAVGRPPHRPARCAARLTCTAAAGSSRAGSPASPWGPARRSLCCRRRTPRATSLRSSSGCRSAIELTDYDPARHPLFVGLSVTPYVYYKEPPTGPHAGEILQPLATRDAHRPRRDSVNPRICRRSPSATGREHCQTVHHPSATGGPIHEQHCTKPRRSQPPGFNPWVIAVRGRRAHVHGGPGHHDRQRGPAVHRRRPVRRADRRRVGHHQLSGRQRHRPADHRLAVGPSGPPQTTSCSRSPSLPSPRRCAASPPAWRK